MRGGKRENSGRKRSENKKIRVSFSLAPDVIDYLNSRNDKPKAQVIEDGLRILKNTEKIKNLSYPITVDVDYLLHSKTNI